MPPTKDILTPEEIVKRDIYEIKRDIQDLTEAMREEHKASQEFRTEIRPLLEIYNGSKFLRSFLMGTGTLVGSIVAIGVGIYTIIEWAKHIK